MTYPSTCIQRGYVYHVCQICGDIQKIRELPLASHSSDLYKYNQEQHYKQCSVCDSDFGFENHQFATDSICTVCGFYKEEAEEDDALRGVSVVGKTPSYRLDTVYVAGVKSFILRKLNKYADNVDVVWYVNDTKVQEDKNSGDDIILNYSNFIVGNTYEIIAIYKNAFGSGCALDKFRF